MDVLLEIVGHLSVEDIVKTRQVSRKFAFVSYQWSTWARAYERSKFLLPEGPLSSQSSVQLENLLIQAAKIHRNWTSSTTTVFKQRRFIRELPTYDFDANVISGRFLQLALHDGISWYDLDSDDMNTPILTYPCRTVLPMSGYLNHQDNANGEGSDSVWVTFACQRPKRIIVLKLNFGKSGYKVKLHAEISAGNITSVKMAHDWILPIREFASPDDPMDLYHIPSRSTFYFPMHENVQHLSDLSTMNYAITSRHLFLLFSLRDETLVDVYTLPKRLDNTPSMLLHPRRLTRSHSGVYPHAISKIQFLDRPRLSNVALKGDDIRVSFLALVYANHSRTSWTSKIALHVIEAHLNRTGLLSFITQSGRTLNVGMTNTMLALSTRSGRCLAVTHSMPGSVLLAHTITLEDSGCTMNVKAISLPKGFQSRDVLAFDGFRDCA
ncbi:hypothetical protein JR316_0007216 [Psilocybe cubensis]|uniref:Uncharacterized protein n=1 Tax=Psilocybe cubensis TaxID=181762 RepID=A0ACB8GYG3_PSICU|nr:hypothetical protein JR316_0007216 [Psilocybe cubensis]KAH9480616.1 hypothetical protein JR316_0007216 [Psilocybe cubensis]